MKKTYKCKLSATGVVISVHEKTIRCEFEPDVVCADGLRGCSYTTNNKEVQKAIESLSRFNSENTNGIWTDDVEESEAKKETMPEQSSVVIVEEPIEVLDEELKIETKRGRKPKTK